MNKNTKHSSLQFEWSMVTIELYSNVHLIVQVNKHRNILASYTASEQSLSNHSSLLAMV